MAETAEVEVKTQDQLLADMRAALDTGDFKAVSKISSEIAKMVAATEKVEKDAKLAALVGTTKKVMGILDNAVKKLVDSGELDEADGIWFAFDFGEKREYGINPSCRLVKVARRTGGTGGGGKKFSISTNELLGKHGSEIMNKETGQTFQEAYDADTGGNARYAIRGKLLKLEGLS